MRILLALLPLALLLSACPRSPADDDDDGGGSVLDQLDRDGDGVLDPDDLDPGQGAAVLEFDFDEGDDDDSGDDDDAAGDPDPEEGSTTTDVSLSAAGSGTWALVATFETSGPAVTVTLYFENFGGGWPEIGTGAVSYASAMPDDSAWYAFSSDAGGEIEILASSAENASGQFTGAATMDVLGEYEQPTGETVTVTAFAFREAPVIQPN